MARLSFTRPWKGGTIHAEADSVAELSKLIQELRSSVEFDKSTTEQTVGFLGTRSAEYPQIIDAGGCADAIRKLLSTSWGRIESRTEAELTSAMRANALHYGHGTISGLLSSMTRRGELRRLKKGGAYAYVAGRSAEKVTEEQRDL